MLGRLLLVALIGAGLAFVSAPVVTFFGIRSAAQANDVAGLVRLIDFPAVRASLRPQLAGRPEIMTPAPSIFDDPIGAVRRRFQQATAPAAPDPDSYLTPDAINALMAGQGRYAATQTVPIEASDAWPRLRYWGFQTTRLSVADAGGSETLFTFQRRAPFEWKLVHIGLPDGATPVAVPRPTDPIASVPERPAAR
nr:DUF2939 domain-containing protein [Brevundimonas variabilis]